MCECELAYPQAYICAWCLCAYCIVTAPCLALISPTPISCGLPTCPYRGREGGLEGVAARQAPDTPARSLSPSDTRGGVQYLQSAASMAIRFRRQTRVTMAMWGSPLRHPTRTRANNRQSVQTSTLSETDCLQALCCSRPKQAGWVGGNRLGPPEAVVAP